MLKYVLAAMLSTMVVALVSLIAVEVVFHPVLILWGCAAAILAVIWSFTYAVIRSIQEDRW